MPKRDISSLVKQLLPVLRSHGEGATVAHCGSLCPQYPLFHRARCKGQKWGEGGMGIAEQDIHTKVENNSDCAHSDPQ